MLASVNGTRLYFDVDGAGKAWRDGTQGVDRPVLLLLPGGPAASHLTYKNPVFGFGRLTSVFQVVYVDWRASGSSDPAPRETLTLAQAVADVEALRRQLGIESWIVTGASAGGMWALEYAWNHPEHVQLLLPLHCPADMARFGDVAEANARKAGVTDEDAIRVYRDFASGAIEGPVETWAPVARQMIMRIQQSLYINPERHPDAIKDHQRRWDSTPGEVLLREFDTCRWYLRDMAANYHPLEHADRIKCPTLIVTGETDPVATPHDARAIHEAIAGSELYVHEGGHMPLGAEQGPFWDRLVDFFESNGIDAASLRSTQAEVGAPV